MAFIQTNTTVATTATPIINIASSGRQNIPVYVDNLDSAAIWVGPKTVTASGATQGHKIAAGSSTQFWLNPGDYVWAVSAAGTGAGLVVVTYSA